MNSISCDGYNASTCPFYTQTDFTKVAEAAQEMSERLSKTLYRTEVTVLNETEVNITTTESSLVTTTNTTIDEFEICLGSPIWFNFLWFIIPLLVYLFWRPISLFFSRHCYGKKGPQVVVKLGEKSRRLTPGVMSPIAVVPSVQGMDGSGAVAGEDEEEEEEWEEVEEIDVE